MGGTRKAVYRPAVANARQAYPIRSAKDRDTPRCRRAAPAQAVPEAGLV